MSAVEAPRVSWASRLSWISLALAFGCAVGYLLVQMLEETFALQKTSGPSLQSLLRLGMFLIWAGEALSIPVGITGLWRLRIENVPLKAIDGIVIRCLAGMALGLCGTLVVWLLAGSAILELLNV